MLFDRNPPFSAFANLKHHPTCSRKTAPQNRTGIPEPGDARCISVLRQVLQKPVVVLQIRPLSYRRSDCLTNRLTNSVPVSPPVVVAAFHVIRTVINRGIVIRVWTI